MSRFDNKLVAVMNKSVPEGKVMNALAHMCIGFGAKLGTEPLQLIDYRTEDNISLPNISKMPFIILRANNGKIKRLFADAKQDGLQCAVFTDSMTVGSWQEQLQRSQQTALEDMVFYGIVVFGPWDKVSELTRKFSLWQ